MKNNLNWADFLPLLFVWGVTYQDSAIYPVAYWATFIWGVVGILTGLWVSSILLNTSTSVVKKMMGGDINYFKVVIWGTATLTLYVIGEELLFYLMLSAVTVANGPALIIKAVKDI